MSDDGLATAYKIYYRSRLDNENVIQYIGAKLEEEAWIGLGFWNRGQTPAVKYFIHSICARMAKLAARGSYDFVPLSRIPRPIPFSVWRWIEDEGEFSLANLEGRVPRAIVKQASANIQRLLKYLSHKGVTTNV